MNTLDRIIAEEIAERFKIFKTRKEVAESLDISMKCLQDRVKKIEKEFKDITIPKPLRTGRRA